MIAPLCGKTPLENGCVEAPKSKKTVQIKNFKGQPILNREEVQKQLINLRCKLQLLLNEEDSQLSLELMYRWVETLVEIGERDSVFEVLRDANREFLTSKLQELSGLDCEDDMLNSLVSAWIHYCKKVSLIKNVYLRYDRSSRDLKFKHVQLVCMDLFKNVIVLDPLVSGKVTKALMKAIFVERVMGFCLTDRLTIEVMFHILKELGVYRELFHSQFLLESQSYFQEEGLNIRENKMNISCYLRHTHRQVWNEKARSYIRRETVECVVTILFREMIERHIENILNQGFKQLMDDKCLDTLKLMYELFSNVPNGVELIAEHFLNHTHNLAQNAVNCGKNKTMIQHLIDLKGDLDGIVEQCFRQNKTFFDIVRSEVEKAVNLNSTESALYLAKFLDSKLRSKNLDEEELEATLKKVLVLFRLIQGKDLFEAFYRRDLGKRLIFGTSTNQDMEKSVVVKLKEECGESFTSSIEGMLKDIELSKSINSNFKEFFANTQPSTAASLDVSVAVLTSSFWSKSTQKPPVVIPDDLLNFQDVFSKHYASIHTGKKLDWQPHMGHCLVRATFGSTVKELQVSLFQTAVLLLFNDANKLSIQEIQATTKLEPKDLITTLHSLSCGKYKILLKEPRNGTVGVEDGFEFNREFTEKLFRIKINQAQFRETAEEQKATESSVLVDRQFQIDAAIVRILKRRKVATHNELLAEMFKVLDIPIHSQVLKKRIELLIEREYIKRDFDNVATYTYVA